MSVSSAITIFVVCLAMSIIASIVLAKRIDQLGTWLGLSEGLLGLLTALAADSPEIASAVTAIVAGQHDLGLGVVFGSNIFNLAALLGLSAIFAGGVRVASVGLWVDGGAGLAVAAIVSSRLCGWINGPVAIVLIVVVLVPYLLISGMKPAYLEKFHARPRLKAILETLLDVSAREKRKPETPPKPSCIDLLGVIPSLTTVVIASVGMVKTASLLGDRWGISRTAIGMVFLAALTGIPNAIAAIGLARRGRGTAVVSETLNSNSVNLIIGALLPVLLFGISPLTARTELAILWSVAMTILALVLLTLSSGLTRPRGLVLVVAYILFLGVFLFWK